MLGHITYKDKDFITICETVKVPTKCSGKHIISVTICTQLRYQSVAVALMAVDSISRVMTDNTVQRESTAPLIRDKLMLIFRRHSRRGEETVDYQNFCSDLNLHVKMEYSIFFLNWANQR